VPAYNTAYKTRRHRGHWIVVERNQEDDSKQSAASGRERETLTLHIIGGNKEGLIKLITEAKRCFLERERARTGDVVKMHAMHYRRH
jgi:hypothetical protein